MKPTSQNKQAVWYDILYVTKFAEETPQGANSHKRACDSNRKCRKRTNFILKNIRACSKTNKLRISPLNRTKATHPSTEKMGFDRLAISTNKSKQQKKQKREKRQKKQMKEKHDVKSLFTSSTLTGEPNQIPNETTFNLLVSVISKKILLGLTCDQYNEDPEEGMDDRKSLTKLCRSKIFADS